LDAGCTHELVDLSFEIGDELERAAADRLIRDEGKPPPSRRESERGNRVAECREMQAYVRQTLKLVGCLLQRGARKCARSSALGCVPEIDE
jgi:hypothetical protein